MKYISFSLWGSVPKYLVGAIENVKLAKEIYPEWRCRFYVPYDEPVSDRSIPDCLIQLAELGAEIRPGDQSIPPMYWRFLVADDPSAEYFAVRDCDSRLSLREKAAVDQWLASGRILHSMRDHGAHCRGLNGGMWGAKGGCLPHMEPLIREWQKSLGRPFEYSDDQEFLGRYIWTQFYAHAMEHDSCCNYPNAIPFPTRREGYRFVGEVFEADGTPRAHDWEAIKPNS